MNNRLEFNNTSLIVNSSTQIIFHTKIPTTEGQVKIKLKVDFEAIPEHLHE